MMELSYRRHRFPPVVIQHAVWLYLRFTVSYRDVEDLLAERGLDISYETVRSWGLKCGPMVAQRLRRHRPRPRGTESLRTCMGLFLSSGCFGGENCAMLGRIGEVRLEHPPASAAV